MSRYLLCAVAVLSLAAQPARRPPALGPWPPVEPRDAGMNESKLAQSRAYAMRGGGSGLVILHGKKVYSWGDQKLKYDLKSTTKSIGVTALGLALSDNKVKLSDTASTCLPGFGVPPDVNRASGWLPKITLFHLATQTAGFDKAGGFEPLLFAPGAEWSYSDGWPNWLADCLTTVYGRDLRDLLFDRVFTPLGISPGDLHWRDNNYRPHSLNGIARREFGSGVHARVLYPDVGHRPRREPALPAQMDERGRQDHVLDLFRQRHFFCPEGHHQMT